MTVRARTRQEMRELDRRAIEEFGIPGVVLMENAGRGAAEEAADLLATHGARRAVILCGKGNNGGDGYVVARHLHNGGTDVELWQVGGVPRPGGDAATNLEIARRMGLAIDSADDDAGRARLRERLGPGAIAVDALLGTGLSGEVREPYRSVIDLLNEGLAPVLAIDGPSGLDGDTGRVLGAAVRAERTVTFGAPKVGFALADGPAHTGPVRLVDLGMPREILEEGETASGR